MSNPQFVPGSNDMSGPQSAADLPPMPGSYLSDEGERTVPLEHLSYPSASGGPVSLIHYRADPTYHPPVSRFESGDTVNSHTSGIGLTDYDQKIAYEDVSNFPTNLGHTDRYAGKPSRTGAPCACICVLFFALAVTFLVAAAGLAVALFILVGNSNPRVNELSAQVANLEAQLLEAQLQETQRIELLETQVASLQGTLTVIVSPSTDGNSSAIISKDLPLYNNCSTQLLGSCSVSTALLSPAPSFSSCSISKQPINVEGQFNIDTKCTVTNPRTEENPIITSLRIDQTNNEMSCWCHVPVIDPDISYDASISCGLFVTRCPTNYAFELGQA